MTGGGKRRNRKHKNLEFRKIILLGQRVNNINKINCSNIHNMKSASLPTLVLCASDSPHRAASLTILLYLLLGQPSLHAWVCKGQESDKQPIPVCRELTAPGRGEEATETANPPISLVIHLRTSGCSQEWRSCSARHTVITPVPQPHGQLRTSLMSPILLTGKPSHRNAKTHSKSWSW